MKVSFRRFAAFALLLCMLFSTRAFAAQQRTDAAGTDEEPYRSYTYWEDYTAGDKTQAYSRPMYTVAQVVTGAQIGVDEGCKLNDIDTAPDGRIYLLDGGTSRIFVLDKDYRPAGTLSGFSYQGEAIDFTGARGILAAADGLLYVADTEHARVLVLDTSGAVQQVLLLPESDLIPTNFVYKPTKVALDSKGYLYVACDGSYYGAILHSPAREFLGFFGANTVRASTLDVLQSLWKRLTSNDVKRAADMLSLPYTFTDIVVGAHDFIYTATGKSGTEDIQVGQIAMLNPGGKDVLDEQAKNFADNAVGSLRRVRQAQDLGCLTVDADGFFYAMDTTYGRIFWYDAECNLLSVFGGSMGDGNQQGTFGLPGGITLSGTDILVSDNQKNNVTIFRMTDYGALVRGAQMLTLAGDFAAAKGAWEQAAAVDAHSQLAFRGLAKAYYDLGDNREAMRCAKLGADRETYAKAFQVRRTEVIEANFYWIALAAVLLIAGLVVLRLRLRRSGRVLVGNAKLRTALSCVPHPAESFRLVKEKGQGSLLISCVLLVLFYVVTVLCDTAGGFAFTVFDSQNYNAFYVLLSTVGLVLLWTVSNWLVCTLAGGIGKLREIFTVTCYSLLPILFGRLLQLVLTHILVPDEAAFLGIFVAACTLYAAFLLIVGMMRIHDYEFGRFLWTTVFTLIFMLIILFLLFLLFLLSQQVFGWLGTLFVEIYYR